MSMVILALCLLLTRACAFSFSEYLALEDFYNSLNGQFWLWREGSDSIDADDDYVLEHDLNINHGPHWNFTGYHDPCLEGWQGINCTCSNSSSVFDFTYLGTNCSIAAIDLADYNLTGQLPSSMSNFTNLRVLYLSYNSIDGTIPASFGNLTHLGFMSLAHNMLASTIPPELGNCSELHHLHLDYNQLTGSIPDSLYELYLMDYLNLEYNNLHGSISPLIGQLTRLTNLQVDDNYLDGTIPVELGLCVNLTQVNLHSNNFHGPVPESFQNLIHLHFLSIYNNQFTGTLPLWFGSLAYLVTFDGGYNQFEGNIENVFGCNQSTPIGLFLNNNYLTGSIPSCLGGNDSIVAELLLSTNYFSGTIPVELTENQLLQGLFLSHNVLSGTIPSFKSPVLRVFYVEHNKFHGNLYSVFDPTIQKDMQYLDFGDNQFTGSIPDAFYQLRTLRSIIMVSNCITGGISNDICNLVGLQYLDLEGLQTADSCQKPIVPFLKSFALQGYTTGTLPGCLFGLRFLETLHISGNAIDSSLPSDLTIGPALEDIVLSHNILRGDIPVTLQTRKFNTLDLSYNCFTGGLHPDFNVSAQTKLEVNRLSGAIPSSFRNAINVTLLNSNMFTCDLVKSTLPLNDPDYSVYECGSNSFDISVVLWMIIAIPTLLVVFGGIAIQYGVIEWASLKVWYSKYVAYYLKWMAVFDINEKAQEQSPIVELGIYLQSLRFTVFRLTVGFCVFLVPIYLALSNYYPMYSHEYAWNAAAVYLSGETPAIILMVMFATLIFSIFASAYDFLWRWMRNEVVVDHETSSRSNTNQTAFNTQRFLLLCGVAILNCSMMLALNGIYIHFVFEYSSGIVTACQILISGLKVVWNEWVVSRIVRRKNKKTFDDLEKTTGPESTRSKRPVSVDLDKVVMRADQCSMDRERDLMELKEQQDKQRLEDAHDMPMLTVMVVFNVIIAPMLANAVLSKQCFQRVFFAPGPTTYYGSFSVCQEEHSLLQKSDLCLSGNAIDVESSYDTPFIYRYQCTSSFINHYAALYVYTFLLTGFFKPIGIALVKYMYDTTKYTKLRSLTKILLNTLLKEDEFHLQRIQRGGTLFRKERFVLNNVGATCVLLSVGVVFPPVAVVILFAIVSNTYLNQLIVGRFVSCFEGIEKELILKSLNRDCEGVAVLFKFSLFIILPFVSCFFAFYLIDIYGDATSWRQAMGVAVVVFSLPLFCYAGFQIYRLFEAIWKLRSERERVFEMLGLRQLDMLRPSYHHRWRSTESVAGGRGRGSVLGGDVERVNVENPLKKNVEMMTVPTLSSNV